MYEISRSRHCVSEMYQLCTHEVRISNQQTYGFARVTSQELFAYLGTAYLTKDIANILQPLSVLCTLSSM